MTGVRFPATEFFFFTEMNILFFYCYSIINDPNKTHYDILSKISKRTNHYKQRFLKTSSRLNSLSLLRSSLFRILQKTSLEVLGSSVLLALDALDNHDKDESKEDEQGSSSVSPLSTKGIVNVTKRELSNRLEKGLKRKDDRNRNGRKIAKIVHHNAHESGPVERGANTSSTQQPDTPTINEETSDVQHNGQSQHDVHGEVIADAIANETTSESHQRENEIVESIEISNNSLVHLQDILDVDASPVGRSSLSHLEEHDDDREEPDHAVLQTTNSSQLVLGVRGLVVHGRILDGEGAEDDVDGQEGNDDTHGNVNTTERVLRKPIVDHTGERGTGDGTKTIEEVHDGEESGLVGGEDDGGHGGRSDIIETHAGGSEELVDDDERVGGGGGGEETTNKASNETAEENSLESVSWLHEGGNHGEDDVAGGAEAVIHAIGDIIGSKVVSHNNACETSRIINESLADH